MTNDLQQRGWSGEHLPAGGGGFLRPGCVNDGNGHEFVGAERPHGHCGSKLLTGEWRLHDANGRFWVQLRMLSGQRILRARSLDIGLELVLPPAHSTWGIRTVAAQ